MAGLWLRQIQGVVRMELGKTMFSSRAFPVWLLAGLPPVLSLLFTFVVTALGDNARVFEDNVEAANVFGKVFESMTLAIVYPGCALIFMNLIRGEVLDRSLHFYFLAPVRREVLLAGKFVAGWISASLIFIASIVASLVLFYCAPGFGEGLRYLTSAGIGHLFSYVTMTSLACLGYGAVFLLFGLLLRNPVVPAVLFLGWEYVRQFLPTLYQKISVIYYLDGLRPFRSPKSVWAIIPDPISPWLGIPGLIIFSAIVLSIAGLRIRKMEVFYGDD